MPESAIKMCICRPSTVRIVDLASVIFEFPNGCRPRIGFGDICEVGLVVGHGEGGGVDGEEHPACVIASQRRDGGPDVAHCQGFGVVYECGVADYG